MTHRDVLGGSTVSVSNMQLFQTIFPTLLRNVPRAQDFETILEGEFARIDEAGGIAWFQHSRSAEIPSLAGVWAVHGCRLEQDSGMYFL